MRHNVSTLLKATLEVVEFTEFAKAPGAPFYGDSAVATFSAWLDSLAERGHAVPQGGLYSSIIFSEALDSSFPAMRPATQASARVSGRRETKKTQWPRMSLYFHLRK